MIQRASKLIYKKNILPEYVTFFVTSRCNLKCKHCFFWKELNKNSDELSLEEIEKISLNMGDFAVLSLTGGEPFLREDLFDIVKIFYKNNNLKHIVIPTNGTIPINGLVENILKACPKLKIRIFVSIDHIKKEHDKIRGVGGTFDKAIKTFKELKTIKNKHLKVGTITTFSKYNENEIFDIYHWLKDNLNPDLMNFPIVRGNPQDASIKDIQINIYERLMKVLNKNLEGGLIKSAKQIMTELNIGIVKKNKYITPCYAGSINAVIYANGDTYPCEILNSKMGNLRDHNYNFKELWFSNKSKEIRSGIKKTKCFCTHGCNMLPNIIFNQKYYPKILLKYLEDLLR
tara:strand:+ start:1166 stop:2197 length:1032 start_codon:yes stop_codon:yes gene_type:complete